MHVLTPVFILMLLFSSQHHLANRSIFQNLPLRMIQLVDFTPAGGGASNYNYFLKTGEHNIFLRLGTDKEAIKHEVSVAHMVSKAGFAPELIDYSIDSKTIATRMVDNLAEFSMHNPAQSSEVAHLIRKFHDSDIRFETTKSPAELLIDLIYESQELALEYPEGFVEGLRNLIPRIGALNPADAKPCHLDLHSGNLLYDGARFWIIDWEYAANSDPLFDLAVLAATEGYTDQEMLDLATAYGKPEAFANLYALRILADARWYIWCLARGQTSTIDFPYAEEAERYLNAFNQRLGMVSLL